MAASGSALSRRVSEVVGVALFAAALIWLIALATYDPNDPVWFFSTGTHDVPANFAGRVGAFLSELSFQVLGYASYLIPAFIAVAGWHYFWCTKIDAVYTKLVGAAMLFACSSAFLGLTLGRVDFGPRAFRAGGYLGEWLGGFMSDYLSRTGSVIVILALIVAVDDSRDAVLVRPPVQRDLRRRGQRRRAGRRGVPAVARGAAQGHAAPRGDGEVRQEGHAGRRQARTEDGQDREALRRRSGQAGCCRRSREGGFVTADRARRRDRRRRSCRRRPWPGRQWPRRCRCPSRSGLNAASARTRCRRRRCSIRRSPRARSTSAN